MISIEKANLIAALKKVMPGVEKGATVIDGADQLLFTGASVSSYNGEIAVSAPCDTQNVSFSVKGADFYNLVSRMSDVMISLEIVDNKVKLKAGRTKASMTLLDSSKVLELVKDLNLASLEYKPLSEDFVDGVRICALAGNVEAIRGVAVGDCGDTSAIFETDTNRVCINKLPEQMESFWVDDGTFNDALKVGTVCEGKVETIKPYGAFVDLGNGISGLVHISQMSTKRVATPEEVCKEGDVVKVKITKVKDGKVSLSMKALEEAPAPSEDDIPELSQVVSHEKATTNLGDLLKNIKLD